jgi:hypothetical protein
MRTFALLAILSFAVACGGGTATPTIPISPTATSGGQPTTAGPTPTAATPTPAGATAPPLPGGSVAIVTLTGGADAGTYTAAADIAPNCSQGIIGPEGWGVQLTNLVAADKELGSIQLVAAAPGKADDEGAFFRGTEFLMTITIGPALGTTSRNYEVGVYTDASDKETSGEGSAQVTDNGATAVIHATGTTADGVGIDATVNCPSVVRT